MGFTKNMAKKAILRVGVAELNAVVEALLSGKFSDEEEGVEQESESISMEIEN